MTMYGASQSVPTEGKGLTFFILGLVVWIAGWAYLESPVQIITTVVGIASMAFGVKVLASLRQEIA